MKRITPSLPSFYILLLFSTLLIPLSLYSEGRSPYRSEIGNVKAFHRAAIGETFYSKISTFEGVHLFRFTRVGVKDTPCTLEGEDREAQNRAAECLPETFKLFRGEITARGKRRVSFRNVAADIIDDTLTVHFHGRRGRRLYSAAQDLGQTQTALRQQPWRRSGLCDGGVLANTENIFPTNSLRTQQENLSPLESLTIEIATDADAEFVKKNRGQRRAFAKIRSLMNTAQTIYMKGIDLSLSIRLQNAYTKKKNQPYKKSNPSGLLRQFRDVNESDLHLGPADLRVLFSGKNFKGSAIGRAFQGVMCSVPYFSYAIVQRTIPLFQAIVLAHEIGHTLDANHDSSRPRTVMTAKLNKSVVKKNRAAANTFSDESLAEINDHISDNMSCLISDALDYAVRPTIDFIELDSAGNFTLRIGALDGEDCSLSLIFYDEDIGLIFLPRTFEITEDDLTAGTITITASEVLIDSSAVPTLTVLVRKSCPINADTLSVRDDGVIQVTTTGSVNSSTDAVRAILQTIEKVE